MMTTINGRTAAHPLEPIVLERWSPRVQAGQILKQLGLKVI